MDIIKKIEDIIEQPLIDKGYGIVRVLLSGNMRRTLQIMIDRLDGVSVDVDDCATVSRTVSVLLDQYDPIEGAYTLEVSSPGLDRPLVKLKDYIRFQGEEVIVKTHEAIDNRKTFIGRLESATETEITLTLTNEPKQENLHITIPFSDIKSTRLHINFDSHN
ncbi:ribosome maturation factor RimP [Candidatus Paracaedibacter symbiosus]|uniref:ribosome maturation factor RimP n=1 Tax=Candidatus Paracaedibacter symbiosus TaxID=244582 RepID=UPI00050955A5|nr:ribosome maturation factor RimP [Candidatus Paracaedibacter symbiosus]